MFVVVLVYYVVVVVVVIIINREINLSSWRRCVRQCCKSQYSLLEPHCMCRSRGVVTGPDHCSAGRLLTGADEAVRCLPRG